MNIFLRAAKRLSIFIPTLADVRLPTTDAIRADGDEADLLDVRDYFRDLQARLKAAPGGRRLVPLDESMIFAPSGVGAGSSAPWARPNMPNSSAGSFATQGGNGGIPFCSTTPRDGGTEYSDCPPSVKHCDVMPLPFNTLTDENFPLVGSAAGTIVQSELHQVKSGRVGAYQPRFLYFVGLNQSSSFAEFPALLDRALVNRNPQLVGATDADSAYVSSVFDNVGAYPVDDWRPFNNIEPQQLALGFGTFSSNAVSLQFFGMFWGRPFSSIDAANAAFRPAAYYPGT